MWASHKHHNVLRVGKSKRAKINSINGFLTIVNNDFAWSRSNNQSFAILELITRHLKCLLERFTKQNILIDLNTDTDVTHFIYLEILGFFFSSHFFRFLLFWALRHKRPMRVCPNFILTLPRRCQLKRLIWQIVFSDYNSGFLKEQEFFSKFYEHTWFSLFCSQVPKWVWSRKC